MNFETTKHQVISHTTYRGKVADTLCCIYESQRRSLLVKTCHICVPFAPLSVPIKRLVTYHVSPAVLTFFPASDRPFDISLNALLASSLASLHRDGRVIVKYGYYLYLNQIPETSQNWIQTAPLECIGSLDREESYVPFQVAASNPPTTPLHGMLWCPLSTRQNILVVVEIVNDRKARSIYPDCATQQKLSSK